MSSSVERVTVASRSRSAHARAADLVERQRQLNDKLDAYFREVAEVKEALRAEGSLWEGPALAPPMEAAFQVWDLRGPKETRIELERLGPVPMMELEE